MGIERPVLRTGSITLLRYVSGGMVRIEHNAIALRIHPNPTAGLYNFARTDVVQRTECCEHSEFMITHRSDKR